VDRGRGGQAVRLDAGEPPGALDQHLVPLARRSAERRHSARGATVGCTRNARRVGTMHASMQTPTITAA
jgi:hypothetical protein